MSVIAVKAKACVPICSTPLFISTEERLEQPKNAYGPIILTLSGITRFLIPVPSKADCMISLTPLGIVNSLSWLQ